MRSQAEKFWKRCSTLPIGVAFACEKGNAKRTMLELEASVDLLCGSQAHLVPRKRATGSSSKSLQGYPANFSSLT